MIFSQHIVNISSRTGLFLGVMLMLSATQLRCDLKDDQRTHIAQINQNISNQSNLKLEATPTSTHTEQPNFANDSEKGISRKVENGAIIAGRSVGLLNMGDTKEMAISYLGNPTQEGNLWIPCKVTEIHWNDYHLDSNGIFIYLKDDKIYQIVSGTKRFKTENGIKPDDDPKKLKGFYPKLEAYELLNTASQINGGANVIYWVDKEQGIAFGLYNYRKLGERRIGSIIVFYPNDEFEPDGCLEQPMNWVKRSKWFLG